MNAHNNIVSELEALQSPLAHMPRTMPYAVPEGYFAMLEAGIRAGISAGEDYRLAIESKAMPHHVPEGYFEGLPAAIATAAQIAHGKQTAPAYTVPEGYFEGFPAAMLAKVKQEQVTTAEKKTIPLWKNLAWAAAAVILLSVGLQTYKAVDAAEATGTEQQLAQLPNGTINEYIQANIDEFDTEMIASNVNSDGAQTTPSQLEEEEIINYLNETGWNGATIN